MQETNTVQHPVILFDGVCNLCTGAVQFVIASDPRSNFRFASLQSKKAGQLLAGLVVNGSLSGTFILIEEGKVYKESTAALRVAKKLRGLWPLLYIFIIVPPFIRNAVYRWVSRHRYQWFGRKATCWTPSPQLQSLFLDHP